MADDFERIKRNVQKMMSMSAPEADIDGYLATESLNPNEFKLVATGKAKLGDIRMTQKSQASIAQAKQAGAHPNLATFAQGGLQDYGDELIGAIEAAKSGFKPGVYTQNRDEARKWLDAARAESTTGTHLAGALTSGIPAALLTGGKTLTGAITSGAGLGGVSAYGATEGNDINALKDIGVGAALGGAGGAAGYGLGKLIERFTPSGLAVGSLNEATAGKTDDLLAQAKAGGTSAAESDEVIREFLRQQAAKNSTAAVGALQPARQRLADVNQQVVQSVDDLISPENVAAFSQRTQDATRAAVRPGYQATETQLAGAIPEEIASLPAYDDALAAAKSLAEFEKRSFDPASLTVKDLDVMQRFLRISKEKAFQGTPLEAMKGATYGNTQKAVNEFAKQASPELAQSQAAVALQKSVDEAVDLGKAALNPQKEAVEVAEEFANLSPEAQAGYRSAFASRLRAQLAATKGAAGTKANVANVLDKPGVVDKMKALGFPAQQIDAILARGEGARGVLDALIGGSQTARLQAAAKASESPLSKLTGGDLVAGALTHPGAVVALPASRGAGNAMERKAAELLIKALTSQNPVLLEGLMAAAPQRFTPLIARLGGVTGALSPGLMQPSRREQLQ